MDFKTYSNLVDWFLENDNREENYQNRILIPFLEMICVDSNVVDTSMLTKEWDNREIERDKFAGKYTPDLLIASNWKLYKSDECIDYKALVEVKKPTADDRKHAMSEIKEYLDKVSFVILTDCVTWEFYMKEDGKVFYSCYSLEQDHKIIHISKNNRYKKKLKLKSTTYNFPTKVCERKCKTSIVWSDKLWNDIKDIIFNGKIGKEKTIVLE